MEKTALFVKILGKTESLADLKNLFAEILKKQGANSVILVSDVDGTITTGAGLGGGMKLDAAGRTRGGEKTLEFFRWLDENRIRWFANSARAQSVSTASSVALTLYKQLQLPSTSYGGECYYVKGKESKYNPPQFWAKKHDYKQSVVWTCNNMVSAAADISGLAYDKDIAIDYILTEYITERPVTVIFTDDNAKNNVAVYEYFARHARQFPNVQLISVHLLPSIKGEDGQEEGLQRLREIISMQ